MEQREILVDLRRTDGKTAVKAHAEVTLTMSLGQITVKQIRVMQNDGQEPWVALPSTTYQKNGKLQRMPLLEARQAILRQIKEAILIEFRRTSD